MYVDRYTIVGIATRYGLGGPKIEYWWGREFPYPSRPALDPRSLLQKGDRVLFPGVNQPGRGVGYPTPSSPKLKEEYSCTFTPSFGLHDLSQGEFYFFYYLQHDLL